MAHLSQAPMLSLRASAPTMAGTMAGTVSLPHHRATLAPKEGATAETSTGPLPVPATPRRTGSGTLTTTYPPTPSARRERIASPDTSRVQAKPAGGERLPSPDLGRLQLRTSGSERLPSPDLGRLQLRTSGSQSSAALLAPAAVAIAASTPVLNGHRAGDGADSKAQLRAPAGVQPASSSTLLAGSSLGHLITKVSSSIADREQEMRKQQAEHRELEEMLTRSKEELQQLVSVVSQLHELQQSAIEVPEIAQMVGGPERPRIRGHPPFFWQPSQEYANEFDVSGESGEVVTKTKDFEDQGWVIPVGGSWRLVKGGLYRWTLRIERKCPSRPQLQLGVHGVNHTQPWRLVTTSRCSWSRDDEPWQDRPGGDRLIDEGDYVHIEVDLRGVHSKHGTFSLAINDEPYEQFFEDIPLSPQYQLMPVVSMGGDQSRVRLCPRY